MRVIIADDQAEVRSALQLILEEKPGISVMGESVSSYDLIWRVREDRPDLVLLDWELPGTQPRVLIAVLQKLCPHLQVIVLSSLPQIRERAISAGATEFFCKSDPLERLLIFLDNCEN